MTKAIIQAGGKGMRLRPYTTVLPKPLMPVADRPILEIVLRQLAQSGFDRITISLGHLGSLIEAVVGDGDAFGTKVSYVRELEPLGTIGPVRLVEDVEDQFLVMNGDLLTDFDFQGFMDNHRASDALISVGVYNKPVPVSLGVFDMSAEGRVNGFTEKPTLYFRCSMGIYAFNRDVIELIPPNTRFGFDDLMKICLDRDIHVRAQIHDGLWLDIGRHEDYEQATEMLDKHRELLLPGHEYLAIDFQT